MRFNIGMLVSFSRGAPDVNARPFALPNYAAT